MIKIVDKKEISPKMYDRLYAKGFRYAVEGEYIFLGHFDRDGLENYTYSVVFFDNKNEAEKYAKTVQVPYTLKGTHPEIKEIPEHTETYREWEKRIEKEEEERKKKREENEKNRAEKMGMTLEEYREKKKAKAKYGRAKNKIPEIENEIEELKRLKAYYEKVIRETEWAR